MYENSYCTIRNHKNTTDLTHIEHIFSTQRQKLSIHKKTSYIIHDYNYVCNHQALTTSTKGGHHINIIILCNSIQLSMILMCENIDENLEIKVT